MSELTLTNGNFNELAEAMGMKQDEKNKAITSTLARLKILHEGVTQETVIKNKKTEYVAVEAGVYELELPNGSKIYQKDPKVRLFLQRFMYQRYIPTRGNYVKTTMATKLKSLNLPDTDGGFNCGRQAGYIEDYESLPQEQKDVDRVRTIFGEIHFDKALGEDGEALDCSKSKSIPFVADFKKEGFRIFEALIKDIVKKEKLLPNCTIQFNTEPRTGKSGNEYHVPFLSLTNEEVQLSTEDQAKFQDFIAWVDNNNNYVLNQHGKNGGSNSEEVEKVKEIDGLAEPTNLTQEPKKKAVKKEAFIPPKKDLESVMSAWTESDDIA